MSLNQQPDQLQSNCQENQLEVAGFVGKTFQILNIPDFNKIVYWSSNGTQFTIKDTVKFQQIVLPKYFRHNKINSFIRQLNMYGFHKTKHNNFKSTFKHPYFQKGKEENLHLIKRKIRSNAQNQVPVKQSQQIIIKPNQIIPPKQSFNIQKSNNQATMACLQKYFNFSNQFIGTTKMINFSLKKVSFNDFSTLGNLQQQKQDCVSIQNEIQNANEREQEIKYFQFQNPSCFFSSRFNF